MKGDILKCACGCGSSVVSRLKNGRWVKYVHGHYGKSKAGRKVARAWGKKYGKMYGKINGPKNLAAWINTPEGKRVLLARGKTLGSEYGKVYGGEIGRKYIHSVRHTIYEGNMAAKLRKLNVKFAWNTKTFPTGNKAGGHYTIDFYLPKWNIALEVDGKDHNTTRLRDKKRDRYLLNKYDLKTVRIRNRDVATFTIRSLSNGK